MGPEANSVIEAESLPERRSQKAAVEGLFRLQSPPDTLHISTALQTTLDLEEMLGLFQQELINHLPVDGIRFHSSEQGVAIQLGEEGRHRADYAMRLLGESLGEVSISRNRPFSGQEQAIIEQLLVPLLYPLRNGLRYHAALATAFHDPLTGLSNRAAMEEALPREVELGLRHKLDLSMLLVDLDHFKKINDGFGHAAGDCVLRTTARMMQQALRTSDHLFRFGGEEFVILLPATDISGAMIVAERIRNNLERHATQWEGHTLRVTASIGAAQLQSGDNQQLLFDRADKAVYRAKALGRNLVSRYED